MVIVIYYVIVYLVYFNVSDSEGIVLLDRVNDLV